LADLTDGKSYFVSDEDTSEALHEAFLGAMTYQSAISSSTDLQIKVIIHQLVMQYHLFFNHIL